MKIYHTETQADYDALMVELEADGAIWSFGEKLSESNNWYVSEHLTCIRVYDSKVNRASLNYYKENYPSVPIIKYKAKADEKMKFTKENVYKLFTQYRKDGISLDDLQDEILKLDDKPEKAIVPKFVADFYEECKNATLHFLITQLEDSDSRSELGRWYRACEGRHKNGTANAQEVIAKMKLYGYEVEKEQLYEVIIAGRNLLKLFHGRIDHEFAEKTELCAWAKAAYQLTEQEIKAIDERYWPFAVPAND